MANAILMLCHGVLGYGAMGKAKNAEANTQIYEEETSDSCAGMPQKKGIRVLDAFEHIHSKADSDLSVLVLLLECVSQ